MGGGRTHHDSLMLTFKGGKVRLWEEEPLTELDEVRGTLPSRNVLIKLKEQMSPTRLTSMTSSLWLMFRSKKLGSLSRPR